MWAFIGGIIVGGLAVKIYEWFIQIKEIFDEDWDLADD